MTESEYNKARWLMYKHKRLATGCCIKCGTPLADNTQPCPHCVEIRAKRRAFRIDNGICVTCGKENDYPYYATCSKCRQKRTDVYAKNKANKLCGRCHRPVDGKYKCCAECRQYARDYAKRRKEECQ